MKHETNDVIITIINYRVPLPIVKYKKITLLVLINYEINLLFLQKRITKNRTFGISLKQTIYKFKTFIFLSKIKV